MSLDETRRAFEGGDFATALRVALDEWRRTRAPEVADAVDAIDAAARAGLALPKARTKVEFQAAWLALFADDDVRAVGWLAETLSEKVHVGVETYGLLDRGYAARRFAALTARVKALSKHAPDPRISRGAVALVHAAPFAVADGNAAAVAYGGALALITATRDLRALASLRDLERAPRARNATLRDYLATHLPGVIAGLETIAPTLDAAARAAWRSFAGAQETEPGQRSQLDGDALLAQIRAQPSDDSLRLVYADWLLERGDVHGDFIVLQDRIARGVATDQEHKQARALARRHSDAWLGPLALVLRGIEYERGFIARAELAQNAVATEATWQAAAADPRLATLRELLQGRGNVDHYRAFLFSPEVRALERIEVTLPSVMEAVLAANYVLPLKIVTLKRRPRRVLLERMAQHPSLAGLGVLQLPSKAAELPALFDELRATGWLDRLTELHLRALDNWGESFTRAVFAFWPSLPATVQRLAVLGWGDIEAERRR